MTSLHTLLWVLLPYVAVASFVVGHAWRYRRDGYSWTARSTQLLERRLLLIGSLAFHFGILGVIGGHVLGVLVPKSWTEAVGISDDAYHWLAIAGGLSTGSLASLGILVLVYRRLKIDRVRAATLRSDLALYPFLLAAITLGMLATILGSVVDHYPYRESVSPWFRSLFTLDPDGGLMVGAPVVYQAHVVVAFVLFTVWPYTRLVHVWSVPISYLGRAPILYRSRDPRTALARRRPTAR